jgi:hypothetical protein
MKVEWRSVERQRLQLEGSGASSEGNGKSNDRGRATG